MCDVEVYCSETLCSTVSCGIQVFYQDLHVPWLQNPRGDPQKQTGIGLLAHLGLVWRSATTIGHAAIRGSYFTSMSSDVFADMTHAKIQHHLLGT